MSGWKAQVVQNFDRGAVSYEQYGDLQKNVARKLVSLMPEMTRPRILEIGCGTGFLTWDLCKKYSGAEICASDISGAMIEQAQQNLQGVEADLSFHVMDGEAPDLTGPYDLIVSSMVMQWFERPEESVVALRGLLKPEGALYYTMPGAECLHEWKEALKEAGRDAGVLSFYSAGGAFEEEITQVRYKSGIAFLQHLRGLGAQTSRAGYGRLTSGELLRALEVFEERFDNQVSWQIVYGRLDAA